MLNFITMILNKNLRDLILDSDHSRAEQLDFKKFSILIMMIFFLMGMDSNGTNCIVD